MIIREIIIQLAEEATFLWFLRTKIVNAPHFSLDDLVQFDERLEAQIDGLRVAGDEAWDICKGKLDSDFAEVLFAAALLAFESGDETRIQGVIDAVKQDQLKSRALISALGWLPCEQARPHIEKFLTAESAFHRYIGIAASAIHRHDPGQHLDKAAMDTFPLLAARALRAYGELGRSIKLNPFNLRENLSDYDDGIRFSTAWAAALEGNTAAIEVLKSFVTQESPYREKALNTALRRMEQTAALSWQKQLAQSPDTIRLAVVATGIIGDPGLVPWLIEQMNTPALARVAGEAFTMITGIDNELAEMQGAQPEGFNAGPNDDPKDSNVAMDADENLPWPNAGLLVTWWNNNRGNYPSGARYLLGKPVTVEHLRHVLKTGLQRQRAAAALELAMMQPGQPLFEVRAPAFRQINEVVKI